MQQIVEPESAQIMGCGDPTPVAADHLGICKFSKPEDDGYQAVLKAIRQTMLPLSPDNPKASPPLSLCTWLRDIQWLTYLLHWQTSTKVVNVLGKAAMVAQENIIIKGDQHISF